MNIKLQQVIELYRMGQLAARPVHPIERTFVLIGKSQDGKSTLGNLLVSQEGVFPTHMAGGVGGMTQKLKIVESSINSNLVNIQEVAQDVWFQVLDQPGLNDPNHNLVEHSMNLIKCLKMSRTPMSMTFVLVISVAGKFFPQETLRNILSLAEQMAEAFYSFFSNALVVLTHKDALLEGGVGSHEELDQALRERCQGDNWRWIQFLLDLVNRRYIFVDARVIDNENRVRTLRDLFKLSQPVVKMMVHGNSHFTSEELQNQLGIVGNCNFIDTRYILEFIFNRDLNLNRDHEQEIHLEEEMVKAGKKLKEIGQGISVMVILVSMRDLFTGESEKNILSIPNSYQINEKMHGEWWRYSLIVFKLENIPNRNPHDTIRHNIASNNGLERLVETVGNRFTFVVEGEGRNECLKRLTEASLMVKTQSEGRSYIDGAVIRELHKSIEYLTRHRSLSKVDNTPVVPSLDEMHKEMADVEGVLTRGKYMSSKVAYFILKQIREDLPGYFELFPHEQVTNEQFYELYISCFMVAERRGTLDSLK